jgi:hypothetical protein
MTTFPKTIDHHAPNIIIYQVHKFEPVISSTYSYTILHELKTTLKPSELYLVRKASSKPLYASTIARIYTQALQAGKPNFDFVGGESELMQIGIHGCKSLLTKHWINP